MNSNISKEDRIQMQLHQLTLTLTSAMDQLSGITNALNGVTFIERKPSALTRQFELIQSPSDYDRTKRRDMKPTPEMMKRDGGKRRVPLIPVSPKDTNRGLELFRSNAIIPNQTEDGFKKMEQDILRKKHERIKNAKPLEALGQGSYNEVQTDDETEDEDLLKVPNFTVGYTFKSKGYSRENIKQWLKRIYYTAISRGLRVVNTKSGIEFCINKLKKVKKGFVVTDYEIRQAADDMGSLMNLFKRIVQFIEDEQDTNNLKM